MMKIKYYKGKVIFIPTREDIGTYDRTQEKSSRLVAEAEHSSMVSHGVDLAGRPNRVYL